MKPMLRPTALTIRDPNNGRMGVLFSTIEIIIPSTPTKISIVGIWDTGATNTVITKRVVDALGLVQIRF